MALRNPRDDATTSKEIPGDAELESIDGGDIAYVTITDYSSLTKTETVVGRRYVGVANVEDWDAVKAELKRRGLEPGYIERMPELDSPE